MLGSGGRPGGSSSSRSSPGCSLQPSASATVGLAPFSETNLGLWDSDVGRGWGSFLLFVNCIQRDFVLQMWVRRPRALGSLTWAERGRARPGARQARRGLVLAALCCRHHPHVFRQSPKPPSLGTGGPRTGARARVAFCGVHRRPGCRAETGQLPRQGCGRQGLCPLADRIADLRSLWKQCPHLPGHLGQWLGHLAAHLVRPWGQSSRSHGSEVDPSLPCPHVNALRLRDLRACLRCRSPRSCAKVPLTHWQSFLPPQVTSAPPRDTPAPCYLQGWALWPRAARPRQAPLATPPAGPRQRPPAQGVALTLALPRDLECSRVPSRAALGPTSPLGPGLA